MHQGWSESWDPPRRCRSRCRRRSERPASVPPASAPDSTPPKSSFKRRLAGPAFAKVSKEQDGSASTVSLSQSADPAAFSASRTRMEEEAHDSPQALNGIEQQSTLACHRMREGWKTERTALINRVRGLMAEFGIWLGRSSQNLARSLPRLIQDEQLPARVRTLL